MNLIEKKYAINTNLDSSGNPHSNSTIERIHQVLGNLVQTYNLHETSVDDANPCMVILAADAFMVRCTYHRTKGKFLGQQVFGRDMILPINHIAG